jgi:hypothetical protein
MQIKAVKMNEINPKYENTRKIHCKHISLFYPRLPPTAKSFGIPINNNKNKSSSNGLKQIKSFLKQTIKTEYS